jgi:hypothetical protein
MRAVVFWLTLALILGALNVTIARRQGLIMSGDATTMRLKLVKSYPSENALELYFEVAQQVSPYLSPMPVASPGPMPPPAPAPKLDRAGCLVVTLDENQVANFVRVHGGESLGSGEHLLGYRMRSAWLTVGPDRFTCESGHAQDYAKAQYAEFRVAPNGDCVLVRLLGSKFEPLGPKK